MEKRTILQTLMAGDPGASSSTGADSSKATWVQEASLAGGETGGLGLPKKGGVIPTMMNAGGFSGGMGSSEEDGIAGEITGEAVSVKGNWV